MKRNNKLYVRPRKLYQADRIKEENALAKKYGLKNKKEIWKTLAKVNYFRGRAKSLATAHLEEQEVFFNKLKKIGLKVDTIADVLALKVEDLLERRLPTIVAKKGLASTPRQARQIIVHKNITIDGNVVNTPSYIVKVEEEPKIALKEKKKPLKVKEEKTVEMPVEESNDNSAEKTEAKENNEEESK